jgi:hypothetical protein
MFALAVIKFTDNVLRLGVVADFTTNVSAGARNRHFYKTRVMPLPFFSCHSEL